MQTAYCAASAPAAAFFGRPRPLPDDAAGARLAAVGFLAGAFFFGAGAASAVPASAATEVVAFSSSFSSSLSSSDFLARLLGVDANSARMPLVPARAIAFA